jgi:HEAT repeat protein
MRPAAILLAASLALAASSERSSAQSPESALWPLLAPRASQAQPDEAALAKKVAALGTGAIRPLLAAYLGELPEPDHDFQIDPRVVDARPRILLGALALLPRADVLREIDAAVREKPDVGRRIALGRALAAFGGEPALRSLLAIASELDPIDWQRPFVQRSLQSSLAQVVRGKDRLALEIAHRVHGAPPGLASILVRALVAAEASAAAPELALALGDPRTDPILAEALAALAEKAPGDLPETALASLRSRLDSPDSRVAGAAALALGRIGDEESAARLAQLLDDKDPVLKATVRKALAALCGIDLETKRAAWEGWIERERAWARSRLAELERVCLAADPATLPEAIVELRQHQLYRRRAARALMPALSSPDARVVQLACGAGL